MNFRWPETMGSKFIFICSSKLVWNSSLIWFNWLFTFLTCCAPLITVATYWFVAFALCAI
jgi:hypothetical protein